MKKEWEKKRRKVEQQYLQICTKEDSTNIYSHIHAEGQAETQEERTAARDKSIIIITR